MFGRPTGMQINERKSTLSFQNMEEDEVEIDMTLFPFEIRPIDEGLKYLRFHHKPNCYKVDWMWMLEKLEKRLNNWSHNGYPELKD
jgi:hypothetical protein